MKVGTFALLDSPTAVEMAGFAGLDFVIIDCEHSTNTSPYGSDFVNMLRAATAGGIPAYVRVRVNDYGMIATALDVGAAGIIVPGVSSAQDMRRAVEAATWQPRGKRGAAPFGRMHRYGFSAIDIEREQRTPLIGPLIENPEGYAALESIAAVEGVGWLWFGHFDMSVALGKTAPLYPDDDVERMRDRMHEVARERGLPAAAFTWDGATARTLFARGAEYVAVSADLSLLAQGLRTIARDARSETRAPLGNG
jgi:4-hydroxy-2-oxoheptanedioate aldolase